MRRQEIVVVAVSLIAALSVCGWAEGDELSPTAQCDAGDNARITVTNQTRRLALGFNPD